MARGRRAPQQVIRRQALSVGLAVAPFGVVFGVACADAGLSTAQAAGFSTLVFSGSAQFAAVGVLDDGGGVATAVLAGLLLNVRSLAFGVLLAPVLSGPFWKRALWSQLVIDESTAVATAQHDPDRRKAGFLAGGIAVFVLWNAATVLGVAVASGGDDAFISDWGLDAAAPAAFLALLWPRVASPHPERREATRTGRRVAVVAALITAAAVPLAPAGLPILLAGLGVVAGGGRRGPSGTNSGTGTEGGRAT